MLPLARAFDTVRIIFIALLPTLALSFAVTALRGAAADEVVPSDSLPAVEIHVDEPPVADASTPASAAEVVLDDNIDVEGSVLDRDEQCCPGHGHRMWRGPRWHWMVP